VTWLPGWRWWAGWIAAGSAGMLGHRGDWWAAGAACAVVVALLAWSARERMAATKATLMALQRMEDASEDARVYDGFHSG
jgi:hypothetical protein